MARRSIDTNRLSGLVLAGGRSVRMGTDKGALCYDPSAKPQVQVAFEQLQLLCQEVWVSVNAEQADSSPYAGLPVIADKVADCGPAAGLLSAMNFDPDTAWLVVAVDMPEVTPGLLSNLLSQRDADQIATLHCHADGSIEPLCGVWEPRARNLIQEEIDSGRASLQRLAREQGASIALLPEPERLLNVNTMAERSAFLDRRDDVDGVDLKAERKGP